ncbi:metallophosphoesterase family protein [Aquamicrobium sp. LC103]|uniref:metallophosphoesterase family protein n=1 Tax=Aquamicrobium sp. LC103 TaxID=1120658 RepID=UPI00063E705A|nr:metallophosphoesterase family protein [Aquamicrobium sp. LC103]TKT74119.1 serine/threonine protein phosphatase [Aquamicrobium sp. LC103]
MAGGVHFRDAAAPDGMRLYAIGDIHGRFDLLRLMHELIETEIARDRPSDWRIIFLGDYEDRGPESRQVIDYLAKATERDPRTVTLAGNHDVIFAGFLLDISHWEQFMSFGGAETARSYGIELATSGLAAMRESYLALVEAVPDEHLDFLRTLELSASFGDLFFCHAGIRPGVPLEKQDSMDLLWIRGEFLNHAGLHPKLIVHGHTPSGGPEVLGNRVNVDTLAYGSGRLTALVVEGKEKRFLTAEIR